MGFEDLLPTNEKLTQSRNRLMRDDRKRNEDHALLRKAIETLVQQGWTAGQVLTVLRTAEDFTDEQLRHRGRYALDRLRKSKT